MVRVQALGIDLPLGEVYARVKMDEMFQPKALTAGSRTCCNARPVLTSGLYTLRPTRWSRPITTRRAACSCGQLHLTIEGESLRTPMCHCLECQRRTGAVISNQARFRRENVTFAGQLTTWKRTAESGNAMTFHFCPACGSTVYWGGEGLPG